MRHIDKKVDSTADNKIVPIDPRQAELVTRISRATTSDGVNCTAFAPLAFIRASDVSQPLPSVYTPGLCIVVQGRKRAIIGNESIYYDAFNYLIVSVTLPVLGQVVDASPERPYLCLRIDIDINEVGKLLLDLESNPSSASQSALPYFIARMPTDLLDVVLRLVRLLDAPDDLSVLGPLALREIWYRVLRGEMGHRLRHLVEVDGPVQRISRAIELLQRRYQQPLRIEELAEVSHMSLSTFHARFKAVTSMSPLQFQKKLRLHEARRLLMTEGVEVATVAHRVGYESPSQFNREYRRLFGSPPRREITSLRQRLVNSSVR